MRVKLLFILLGISLTTLPVFAEQRSAKWSFETGDYIVASIVMQNDTVFVGSANGNLYALNSTAGDLLWKYGKVGRIESSPAVSDRMVFFGSNDGNLYAVWLNGTLAWSFKTKDKILSSPAVSDRMVFFGSNDGNLYAVWLNGTLAWSFKTKDKILSSPAFAYDFVYFGSSDGNFYALEAATGRMVWNYSSFSAFSSSPLASNWVIYTGSDENKLYAFQAFNGTILWSQRFPGKIQSSFTISPQNTLVFPSKDGNIYAVFAGDGSQLWNISTGTEAQSSVHYGDESGFLYFGTTDNDVYAVNSSGHIVWKYETGNWVISTPKLYHGILYVGSYDGSLYAVSTIHTAFPSNSMNASGSPALIEGESSTDAGVKYVEVRVDFGEWVNASRAEKWNYSWDTSSLKDGTYTFEARSVDNNGNVELPPYAKAIIHFRSKVEMKELNVSFQPTVVVGIPIKFEVKDNDGNPVPYPQVSIFGKTYTGDEKGVVEKDDKGNFIKADNEGEFNFTVSKEGYAPPKGVLKIKAMKIIDILPYLAASILIPLLISLPVVYFLLKKFRGMKKQ